MLVLTPENCPTPDLRPSSYSNSTPVVIKSPFLPSTPSIALSDVCLIESPRCFTPDPLNCLPPPAAASATNADGVECLTPVPRVPEGFLIDQSGIKKKRKKRKDELLSSPTSSFRQRLPPYTRIHNKLSSRPDNKKTDIEFSDDSDNNDLNSRPPIVLIDNKKNISSPSSLCHIAGLLAGRASDIKHDWRPLRSSSKGLNLRTSTLLGSSPPYSFRRWRPPTPTAASMAYSSRPFDEKRSSTSLCSTCTTPCGLASILVSKDDYIGISDVFKIGIGPSSSHTMGPMTAGFQFANKLLAWLKGAPDLSVEATPKQDVANSNNGHISLTVDLYGSLASTGKGHCTDRAVVLGLAGWAVESIDLEAAEQTWQSIIKNNQLQIGGNYKINFNVEKNVIFFPDIQLPRHPNALTISASDGNGKILLKETYFSIGGGFIETDEPCEEDLNKNKKGREPPIKIPNDFKTCSELLSLCKKKGVSIADAIIENEIVYKQSDQNKILKSLDRIIQEMENCIHRGMSLEGFLPVSNIPRRAAQVHRRLLAQEKSNATPDPLTVSDWIALYARAVNEENACGGRVVTAPTNGAAGTVPAVLMYYKRFIPNASLEGQRSFIATAAAVGALCKRNGSISGAEAGCQAEVGSACSMAAAGLTAVLGGSMAQVENAAEIALEHCLGMTCDPVGGLVQIPCIERNCVAAVKAVIASRLALCGDGNHEVSLDSCIETMYRTGLDMSQKYRETSTGGLALYARKMQEKVM